MNCPSKISLKDALVDETNSSPKEPKVGRYSISQIYSYINGWTTPKQYLEGETFDFVSSFRMWEGTAKHKQIEPLMERLGYEVELKKEYDCGEFVIVGMADYLKDNIVADLKTSREIIGEAKKWSLFQVKIYCTVFERDYGIIFEPKVKMGSVPNPRGIAKDCIVDLWLDNIGTVERNDKWFEAQMLKLSEFHKAVVVEHEKLTKTP